MATGVEGARAYVVFPGGRVVEIHVTDVSYRAERNNVRHAGVHYGMTEVEIRGAARSQGPSSIADLDQTIEILESVREKAIAAMENAQVALTERALKEANRYVWVCSSCSFIKRLPPGVDPDPDGLHRNSGCPGDIFLAEPGVGEP